MKKLFVFCTEQGLVDRLHHAAEDMGLEMACFSDLETLAAALSRDIPCIILLDLDSLEFSDTQIHRMAALAPQSTLMALSHRSFHPELATAFAQHIRVCIRKPVDMTELSFWLRSFTC